MPAAITAASFIGTLGVNTHIGSSGAYSNSPEIAQNIKYLGITTVRDSIADASVISQWQQVARDAGIKFDDCAIGGTETVMAFLGGSRITTGGYNDTIRISGTGNVVNAGSGSNEIDDSGSGNRIVLPVAGHGGDRIYGYVLQNGDTLDLRPLLKGTAWAGGASTLGNFVHVTASPGADAIISVTPSGIAGGATYTVATLEGSGPVSLSALLAHSMT